MTTRQIFSYFGWAPAAMVFAAISAPLAMAQTDIRSFGARCDGSDDSGAVQAALNSVPNGGTVVISCSAGIGGSGITLANKSSVTVAGTGGSAGFRALAATGLGVGGFGPVMFAIRNCSNCVIKDLTIDNRNIGVSGVGFERCSGSTIQNVSISNTAYPANAAIVASGGSGNSYIGNTIRFTQKVSGDGTRGMWIGNGGDQTEMNATIANNTVSDVGATGIATHVNNATIKGNLVTNAAGAGIKVTPTTGLGGQTTIEGNTVRGNLFHGIQISKADTPVIVQGNTIDGNAIAGIYASDGAFYGRITGNTITNHNEAGIYLYNGDGLSIDNNEIIGNSHGILLEVPGGYTIRGLQITSNNISGQRSNGITMWGRGGTIDTLSIASNSIYDGSMYGVFVEKNSGTLTGFSASGNCYANDASGTVFDNTYQLSPVPFSASCPNPATSTSTSDRTAPSVAVTSPGNGATVSGTITVTATATDNVGVAGVQLYLNGAAFGPKLTTAPFSAPWDTRTVANGSYQWTAVAQDAAGNSATSTVVFAQVANADTTAPTVRILTPASGSIVSGTVGLTASASDNIGVTGVQYGLNGAALGAEVSASPYAYSWNTAGLAPGNYTISATARDAAGNLTSTSVIVSIKDTTAPTVRITAPAAGATVSGTISLTAAASDNVGVAGVQFLVDGAAYGAESTSGFSVGCNTTYLSNGSHSISAIARDAAGNKTTAAAVSVNVSNTTAVQPPTTTTTTAVARINAGGGAYTDPSGNVWSADSGYTGGYSYAPGKTVSGTTTPELYQSQRWNDRPLVYDFSVANGTYTVNLKFAELYFGRTRQRVFNIAINGQAVLNNFDIVAAAGGPAKAVDRSFPVNVTGGKITIQLAATVDDPAVNAIEILKVTTTTAPAPTVPRTAIRVNAGGASYTDAAGNTWSADTGASGGYMWGTGATIANTTTPTLYQSLRWNSGTLGYQFSVPSGTYTVNLKFAELYFSGAGQRVFDVTINGQKVLANFDIVQQAGGSNRAIDKAFTVNATNGTIAIQLTSTVDDPQINAIEIYN